MSFDIFICSFCADLSLPSVAAVVWLFVCAVAATAAAFVDDLSCCCWRVGGGGPPPFTIPLGAPTAEAWWGVFDWNEESATWNDANFLPPQPYRVMLTCLSLRNYNFDSYILGCWLSGSDSNQEKSSLLSVPSQYLKLAFNILGYTRFLDATF